MWDNLTALQLATVKETQTVLFIRKLARHIRNLINPRAFKELEDLIQRRSELWAAQTPEEAAAAAAPRLQSPFRSARRSPSPFRCYCSPTPGPTRGSCNNRLCFYHSRFGNKAHKCEKDCSYQEN